MATIDDIGGVLDLTDASFDGAHTYADNGAYTITIRVADDDMSANFTGGVNGVDYVQQTVAVTVNNVVPTLTPAGPQVVNEGTQLSITNLGTITDPGFNNPQNPNAPPTGSVETFTYYINWGDGTTAESGVATIDDIGGVLDPTDASFAGMHTYADDGVYLVTIRVADDDMSANFTGGVNGVDYVQQTLTVTVTNVIPVLTDINPVNTVEEGQAFVLSNLGGPLPNMGVGLSDPGFDNLLNTNPLVPPAIGDPLRETFTGFTIDWGDGTPDTPVTIVNRVSGGPGTATTAVFSHDAAHTYADDGVYTVRVRVADDNMSGDFTTGTNGVDYIDLEFTITVTNVAPTLAAPAPSTTDINENGSVNFTMTFSDPGFDNAANDNTPAERRRGGRNIHVRHRLGRWARQTVSNVSRCRLERVGAHAIGRLVRREPHLCRRRQLHRYRHHSRRRWRHARTNVQVLVQNVAPSITLPLEGDEVNTQGITRIRFAFSDPGFDNPPNTNAAAERRSIPGIVHVPGRLGRRHGRYDHRVAGGTGQPGRRQFADNGSVVCPHERQRGHFDDRLVRGGAPIPGSARSAESVGRHPDYGHADRRQRRHGGRFGRGRQPGHRRRQRGDRHDAGRAAAGVCAAASRAGLHRSECDDAAKPCKPRMSAWPPASWRSPPIDIWNCK